jgi:arylsulfatase A-like enzyme
MARTDGYQLILTWDDILSKIFGRSDDILKLDTDKHRFGQVELSSTLKQLDAVLDNRHDQRPILFYTQAMNVQVHAENCLPKMSDTNWRRRPGFNNRIAYTLHQADDILGGFFSDLKKRGLYDNSIIVVTADHGDATGEFGRLSHSTIVYPEVMKVPLIIHLPDSMQGKYVFDENRLAALTDIAPTIYYVLGHRPVAHNLLFGMPVVAETRQELQTYTPHDLFLASDMRPIFGLLTTDRRYFYTHGTTPPQRMLFDLKTDPNAERNLANETNSKAYDERILEYLHAIAQMYGFRYMGG